LLASQLRKAIERNAPNILCTFCGKQINQPDLNVIIGKKVYRNIKIVKNYTEVKTKFISAETLFEMVKEKLDEPGVDFHIDLISLRTDFDVRTIFWNLIYYFNEYHLPYEFILPYEDTEFVTEFKEYKKEVKKSLRVYKPDPNKLKSSKSRKAPTIVS